jgi:hypothetical protein
MKKIILIILITIFISSNLFAQDTTSLKNTSISLDPLSLIGAVLFFGDGINEYTSNFICFGMDLNLETSEKNEMSMGFFIGTHRLTLMTKYRFFNNSEKLSGFFWGLYGLIEWRRMDWFYNENRLSIDWIIPSTEQSKVYQSIGITGGLDIGLRLRINNFGITPYLGLGIPLFICFGDLPSQYIRDFYVMNIALRAINIGLKLDFFIN